MARTTKFKIWGAIATLFVVINGYLLLKNNDVIPKSYYIGDVQYAVSGVHTKELDKESILATSNEMRLAAPVQAIDKVLVKRGDAVTMQQELASYKSDAVEQERKKLEIERKAYEAELKELEQILSALERESSSARPSTATDSTTIGDSNIWNLNLSLELGIEQNTPTAEGKAMIRRHIAETERQLDITDSLLTQLISYQTLATPVDGVVGDIQQDGDTITFVIYPSSKSVATYIDEAQWQRVEVGQRAIIIVRAGEEEESTVEGIVTEKQAIPAEESMWYQELLKYEKIDPAKTLYEVQIQPTDLLTDYPYGEKVAVTITTDEVFSSFKVHSDWIIHYAVPDIGNTHIYTLGYDGRTRLTPVDIAFTKLGQVDAPVEEVVIPEDEPAEEEIIEEKTPAIQTVDFSTEEEEVIDEELYDVTVFTGAIDENTILLDGTARNIYAPTFRPYPLQKYEWEKVGEITWRDIVKFIAQP
ncbi:HlyD family secretion protein [Lysinibacillus sp. LZ02]|uniref:HlyD family secretion protein n=1 Tax=Lysinibacillus sp. LZ02 TaxID=3420668 RepID=UPI003D36E1D1